MHAGVCVRMPVCLGAVKGVGFRTRVAMGSRVWARVCACVHEFMITSTCLQA